MFFYDWTYFLILPAVALALYAQYKVKSSFNKYSKVESRSGMTGAEAARRILENYGVRDVVIEPVKGNLSDHYDPRTNTLRLSEAVYGSKSLSAIGVAAHESGHALQRRDGYAPLGVRSAIVPVVSLGSNLAWPVLIIGLLLTQVGGQIGWVLLNVGIVLFALVVVFSLITLPVEFNASKRAVAELQSDHIITADEVAPVKQVLSSAAMTYVASAAMAIMQLIRVMLLAGNRRG